MNIDLSLIIYVKITTNTTETTTSTNGTILSSEWQPGTVSIRSALSLNSSDTLGKSIGSLEKMNQMRPDDRTLEELFQKTIAAMDLPADKLKMLREFPPDKKWDIIRDRDQVIAKHPPQYYIDGLKTYIRGANLVPKASTLKKKQPIEPSTQLLSSLEISLRTNTIGWVHEFLNSYNKGLDVLLDYLITSLEVMREVNNSNDIAFLSNSNGNHHLLPISILNNESHNYVDENSTLKRSTLGRSDAKRLHRKIKKYQIGEATDDVRLCIMCLRAIMNNQNGFNLVIQHPAALNYITLSLQHKNYRCKSLILELLAAVCLVELGHDVILAAFDNFRIVCQERHRFETLMKSFTQPLEFNVDYMIACMQFINIIVHSVQDMNYRVYLQEEFKLLGLDECLKKYLEIHSECDLFILQIHAFLDNYFDVGQLLEDSETKQQAITKVAELEEQLGITSERIQELENGNSSKLAELQKALSSAEEQMENVRKERDDISHTLNTLRRSQHERGSSNSSTSSISSTPPGAPTSISSTASHIPPAPPLPPPNFIPPPPPPGPPPPISGIPPPPGMLDAPPGSMTIKKKIPTKYKLPNLNWTSLKPGQVRGTVFCELDDEKYFKLIDFETFEELFKTGSGLPINQANVSPNFKQKYMRMPESLTLLDPQRQRNLGIARRKLDLDVNVISRALNNLDLKILTPDTIDILQHFIPTEAEIKAFTSYLSDGKSVMNLSDEDQFLYGLSKIERLSQKLNVVSFMANFYEINQNLAPQLKAIITASSSLKNNTRFKKLLEIILAFGNYMNSSKRGPVYGFKLATLEILTDTRTHDKRLTLLHFIVQTIEERFPDIVHFDTDLQAVEKAAQVSLENVQIDVQDLTRGLDNAKKELVIRQTIKNVETRSLEEFINIAQDKIDRLVKDAKLAQDSFNQCVEYFGEAPRTQSPSNFFSIYVKFQRAYQQARHENEERKRLAREAAATLDRPNKRQIIKRTQEELLNELKGRKEAIKDQKLIKREALTDGTIETLLDDLKKAPYLRADAARRNRRKTQELMKQISRDVLAGTTNGININNNTLTEVHF
ncbi:unnamed protein product [Rotaria sp. Silwood2]|nr:unnamed protein product [Rotaria sp. Silwood2]CAF2835117.1 unnamed protein product [Rotaria sp. Silwood2]CAF2993115.1 unnamed protein product [Rotaria sp. Silwood2]CAF3955828.1 unnamed protein product [Rotaria sp. Silwood2]